MMVQRIGLPAVIMPLLFCFALLQCRAQGAGQNPQNPGGTTTPAGGQPQAAKPPAAKPNIVQVLPLGKAPAPRPAAKAPVKAPVKPTKPVNPSANPSPAPSAAQSKPGYLQAACSLRDLKCYSPTGDDAMALPLGSTYVPAMGCGGDLTSFEPVADGNDAVSTLTSLPSGYWLAATGSDVLVFSGKSQVDMAALQRVKQELGWYAATQGIRLEVSAQRPGSAYTTSPGLANLAPSGMKVSAQDGRTLQITTDKTVSCYTLLVFLRQLNQFASHRRTESPVATVLYLDPAATANALTASAIPFAGTLTSSPGGAAMQGPPAAPPVPVAQPATGSATAPAPAPASSTSGASGSSTASAMNTTTAGATNTTGATSATPSAGATGAVSSNTGTATPAPATASGPGGGSVGGTPGGGGSSQASSLAAPFSVNGRQLIFGSSAGGDDSWITEKKRALALLDLPQPQVLINTWSLQSSTDRPDDFGTLVNLLHDTVNGFNDVIQNSITAAWRSVSKDLLADGWEPTFHNYVAQRALLAVDAAPSSYRLTSTPSLQPNKPGASSRPDTPGPRPLSPVSDTTRTFLNACGEKEYCLGYSSLIPSVNPRITDLLIGVIGAKNPMTIVNRAMTHIAQICPDCRGKVDDKAEIRKQMPSLERFSMGCQVADEHALLDNSGGYLSLECFRAAVQRAGGGRYCQCDTILDTPGEGDQFGLIRAALADFLFQYKMSSEYPHDFSPYDLSASAQALDGALAPFTEAFNEDLQAFQTYVRAKFIVESVPLHRRSKSFLNSGIVTVRTTSGDTATVSAGTQSFLDQSRAPTLNELVTGIAGTNPASSGTALSGVLSNLSFNQAQVLEGALSAFHSQTLSVGRQLNLTVKPRSLLGASAAEIDIVFNADQGSSAPAYWTAGGSSSAANPALSQVTQHDVTTHVRIDSVRLFEISSFSAILSKGRDKFPLLPPLVELPYIGTFAGIPLKAATEYHTSSAMMSATIVPTASDLAYTLRYVGDRVWNPDDDRGCGWPGNVPTLTPPVNVTTPPCTVRRAGSLRDFGNLPILEFHRKKLVCIAAVGSSIAAPGCPNPSFSDVISDESL